MKRRADLIRSLVLDQPTTYWPADVVEYHRRLLDEPGVADKAQLEQSQFEDRDWIGAGELLAANGFSSDHYEVRVAIALGFARDRTEQA